MEDRERQQVLDRLQSTRERILGLVEGLDPEQWAFKPGADRWSIHQVLDHVVAVENRVVGLIQQKLQGTPEPDKQSQASDDLLIAGVPDRTVRRQAPEAVQPAGQWAAGQEVVAEFAKVRARTLDFANTCTHNLRHYFQSHGAFGELDCYQWLMLIGLHAERHASQIEEVKATAGYPSAASVTA
jgi:uncharacterized damage-inducible protein DinB